MSLFDKVPENISDISVRNENSIQKPFTEDVEHDLDAIKNMFDEDISNVKKMFDLQTDQCLDNIFRSQIVFLASIYDFYMHNIFKFGFLQIYKGIWGSTSSYNNHKITMGYLHHALEWSDDYSKLLSFLNETNRITTMMSYDSLVSNCKIIGLDIANILEELHNKKRIKNKDNSTLKTELDKIYTKRNSIAHQFDRSHKDGNTLSVTNEEVNEMMNFIETLGLIIYNECKLKDTNE